MPDIEHHKTSSSARFLSNDEIRAVWPVLGRAPHSSWSSLPPRGLARSPRCGGSTSIWTQASGLCQGHQLWLERDQEQTRTRGPLGAPVLELLHELDRSHPAMCFHPARADASASHPPERSGPTSKSRGFGRMICGPRGHADGYAWDCATAYLACAQPRGGRRHRRLCPPLTKTRT